jgi:hypothetical protein
MSRKGLSILATLLALSAGAAGEPIAVVTVDDFVPTRTIEVEAGTEVVFSDVRFLDVSIVADDGAPAARRIPGGFAAVFERPGTYRFLGTLVGVDRPGIVPGRVIVWPRPGVPSSLDSVLAGQGVSEVEFRRAQDECLRDPRTAGSVRLYLMCMQSHGVQPIE